MFDVPLTDRFDEPIDRFSRLSGQADIDFLRMRHELLGAVGGWLGESIGGECEFSRPAGRGGGGRLGDCMDLHIQFWQPLAISRKPASMTSSPCPAIMARR